MRGTVKFTVIVPTRERPDTLVHCLRTLVEQDYDNAVFIVSDNCSQDNTKEVVKSFNDPRIRYINTGKRISMSHNWEFALGHVTDGWITILGDDDGMLPGGLAKVARVIKESDCQAVNSKYCHYFWPNSTDRENQLSIPLGNRVEYRSGNQWLKKVMRGIAPYTELPWLYTGGFVNSTLVNDARDRSGRFFLSLTPDIYSAIALAAVTNRYVVMHETVCIAGQSKHSTGASSWSEKNQGAAHKFYSEENIPFHSKLGPKIVRSATILIYECYLQSMHIHKNHLKINTLDQLAQARALALSQQYEEVRSYSVEIAQRNGIDAGRIERAESLLRFKALFHKFSLQKIKNLWQCMVVNAKDFDVKDVYTAALLSNALVVFHSQYADWRWRNIVNIIARGRALFRMGRGAK